MNLISKYTLKNNNIHYPINCTIHKYAEFYRYYGNE